MTDLSNEINKAVRTWLLEECLPGESPDVLQDSTPLIDDGILDSIATVKIVAFLEERYGIKVEAHDMSADCFGSVASIVSFVQSKMAEN